MKKNHFLITFLEVFDQNPGNSSSPRRRSKPAQPPRRWWLWWYYTGRGVLEQEGLPQSDLMEDIGIPRPHQIHIPTLESKYRSMQRQRRRGEWSGVESLPLSLPVMRIGPRLAPRPIPIHAVRRFNRFNHSPCREDQNFALKFLTAKKTW